MFEATQRHYEQFTEGDCWILAIEINRADPTWSLAQFDGHAFCVKVVGDATLAVDVHGVTPVAKLLTFWGVPNIDWEYCDGYVGWGCGPDLDESSYIDSGQTAREIAPLLIQS